MAGTTQVLQRYANALYQLAHEQGQAEAVVVQLDALSETIAGNEELRMHLGSPRMPNASKKALLAGVMGSGVTDLARRTVDLLVDRGRGALVSDLGPVYRDVAMAAAGRAIAKVTSVQPLDDEQRGRLVAQLNQLTGKIVTLEETTDASLLGGVKIVLGSQMIDGSLRRRLEDLGETLYRVQLGAD